MYNIKQAAARAGVTVPVLRAWERRYRIVEPARTPSGYRQFDDAAVARIRTMRGLVDAGWSPSTAAAAILAGEAPAEVDASAEAHFGPDSPPEGGSDVDAVRRRFVAAAARLDPGAIEDVLDDVFMRGSFERAATDGLFPALRALGDAWASGTVSVAGEHLASAAVQRRLGQALDAAARPGAASATEARVLVGLPPGGRHELGALAFAVAARRAGIPVSYLGPDLPVEDWLRAAPGMAAAVIGVVTRRDRTAGLEVARRLRAAEPTLVIALGGFAAPMPSEDLTFIVLPTLVTDAVDTLAQALRQGGVRDSSRHRTNTPRGSPAP